MFIDNYYFFLGQGEGQAYGVLTFKVLSAEEQDDGIIVLGLVNEKDEWLEAKIERKVADCYTFFKDRSASDLVGRIIYIEYYLTTYDPDHKDEYFAVDDVDELAIILKAFEDAPEDYAKEFAYYEDDRKLCYLRKKEKDLVEVFRKLPRDKAEALLEFVKKYS